MPAAIFLLLYCIIDDNSKQNFRIFCFFFLITGSSCSSLKINLIGLGVKMKTGRTAYQAKNTAAEQQSILGSRLFSETIRIYYLINQRAIYLR